MSAPEPVRAIAVDLIRAGRNQARRRFDPAALEELAQSIRESGVVQPVVLRSAARGYELLAGERRWRAAQLAGLHEIPALIRNDLGEDEAQVLGLVENLQRESLSPIETAQGLQKLIQLKALTHEAIGVRIGKSRVYVTNFLRLLSLAPAVQALVDEQSLSLGHAKVLAGVSQERQLSLAQTVIARRLTVRALERLLAPQRRDARPVAKDEWSRLAAEISYQLGYPAAFVPESATKGELRLRFHSLDELDGLLERIGYRRE